jgi:hypothetical protein
MGADQPKDEIELCDFKVPADVAEANASFTVIYALDIGVSGGPSKVTKLKNDFLKDEPFTDCFMRWALPVRNERITVYLSWEHGKGWTRVALEGKHINRRILIHQGW